MRHVLIYIRSEKVVASGQFLKKKVQTSEHLHVVPVIERCVLRESNTSVQIYSALGSSVRSIFFWSFFWYFLIYDFHIFRHVLDSGAHLRVGRLSLISNLPQLRMLVGVQSYQCGDFAWSGPACSHRRRFTWPFCRNFAWSYFMKKLKFLETHRCLVSLERPKLSRPIRALLRLHCSVFEDSKALLR